MGRKSINIDPDQVRALARLSCSYEEIADVLKIGRSTFAKKLKEEKEIRDAYERGKSEGAVSLKRAQFDTAVSGNTAMLIWLGKNRLGQADRIETKNETEITATGALDKLNNSIARIVERKRQD
tara:strand:+ start:1161 stop:1532 length:372 start_codon:yes stop_codon:yes gene_type:complete